MSRPGLNIGILPLSKDRLLVEEYVDVRVDGLDYIESLSFDIEDVAYDFDTAKLTGQTFKTSTSHRRVRT